VAGPKEYFWWATKIVILGSADGNCNKNANLIGSYIRSWEKPGDLPRVIEILCLFASGTQRNERKDTKISITLGRSPGLSQQSMQVSISSVNQQLSLSRTPRDPHHWYKWSDQYHWALWNTHHIKLTFVTQTNKLSSFLLIFELFSLIFIWKYSIFLHETPHKWNMTWHIFWRHWRMTSKVRKRTSRNTKKWK
jgi:hypothetical protein